MIVPKGSFDEIKRAGLEAFRTSVAQVVPFLADRLHEIDDWTRISVLTVQLNRLRRWHCDGLLCIGDAAHAMSPAGGVGINLAVQDAVAAANLLAGPLREKRLTESLLAAVQCCRELPAQITQAVQMVVHRGFNWVFRNPGPIKAPWQLKLGLQVLRVPGVRRALAHAIGVGVRPEHVHDVAQPVRRRGIAPASGVVLPVTGLALAAAAAAAAAFLAVRRLRLKKSSRGQERVRARVA